MLRRRWAWAAAIVIVVSAIALRPWRSHDASNEPHHERTPAAAAAHAGARAASPSASISGRVTCASNGSAIGGAVVAVAPVKPPVFIEWPYIVTSDAGGGWTIDAAPGIYVVTASAPGFVPMTSLRIEVAANDARTGLDLALAAGGVTVRGLVTDIGGGPIVGARVSASRNSDDAWHRASNVALTSADGSYQLTLGNGSYRLVATHDDYASLRHDLDVLDSPPVADLVLMPASTIAGQVVVRSSGRPLPDATVVVRNDDLVSATTDAEGHFVVRNLSSGRSTVFVRAHGYASADETPVDLGIGDRREDVRLEVGPAFAITGHVVRTTAPTAGIAGVMLYAYSDDDQLRVPAIGPTDRSGAFEIVGVRAGRHALLADGEGYLASFEQVVHVADRDVAGVRIELETGGTIRGRVEPPSRARIWLDSTSDDALAESGWDLGRVHTESDSDGTFVLHAVPAGSLVISAATADGATGSASVKISGAEDVTVLVGVNARASIRGKVVDPSGSPVVGAYVAVAQYHRPTAAFWTVGSATSGADGSFRIVDLGSGAARVQASLDTELAHMLLQFEHGARPPIEIELLAGVERVNVIVVADVLDGSLAGRVMGSDGQPAPDTYVSATRTNTMTASVASATVVTSATGDFKFPHLLPGTYNLDAHTARGDAHGAASNVATGSAVSIALAPLARLRGHVMAGAIAAVPCELTCSGPDFRRWRRYVSGADGAYSFDRLQPGHYKCSATSDAGIAAGEVDVAAAGAQLELAIDMWATVSGTVIDVISGKPVGGVRATIAGSEMNPDPLDRHAAVTDADGRFVADRVPGGSGYVNVISDHDGSVGFRDFSIAAGQRIDLGTISVIPVRTGALGWIGIRVSDDAARTTITEVRSDSPAGKAGIRAGDVLLSINGRAVGEIAPLTQSFFDKIVAGERVQLGIERGVFVVVAEAR